MVHRLCNIVAGPVAAFVVASLATTAMAATEPTTRLVSCGAETCLVIAGHRESAQSLVAINGNVVAVEGKRNWHVRLPLAAVRAWSAPFARSIAVTVAQTDGRMEASTEADLPIGLLGHRTDLAALVVRAR